MKGWEAPHPDGMKRIPVGWNGASSPGHGDRPQERCEADWIGQRGRTAPQLWRPKPPGHGADGGQRAWGAGSDVGRGLASGNPLVVLTPFAASPAREVRKDARIISGRWRSFLFTQGFVVALDGEPSFIGLQLCHIALVVPAQ